MVAKKLVKLPKQTKSKIQSTSKNQILPPTDFPVWVTLILFFITTAIFFWDIILQNSFFWEDFIEYVYPVQTFAANEFAKGEIPFWNAFTFVGMPFFADLQVGFFYPFNRILSLFVSNNNLPVVILELVVIIHFLISQINTYFLARFFKISSYGAVIAAISYSFSMLMVCHVIHPMIVYHLTWLPLILMFFLKGLQQKKLSNSILAGIIFGFVMLSGHPQMTLYMGLLLGFAFVWFLISGFLDKSIVGINLVKFISGGILTIVIALGIFYIQYLPSKDLAELSQRNEISYEKSTEGSLEFKNIITSVIPKIFGYIDGQPDKQQTYYNKIDGKVQSHFYWETGFYFGIVALFLGLIGAILKFRTSQGGFLIFIAVFGCLFALGSGSFVFNIMYHFPFFNSFRNPGRMMFMATLGFSILAGFGFDILWQNIKEKKMMWVILSAAFFPILFSILTATGYLPKMFNAPELAIDEIISFGTIALTISVVAYAIAFIVNWKLINPSVAGLLFIALAFIDLYVVGGKFNQSPTNPATVYELKPDLKALLTPKSKEDLYRVNTRIYKPVSFMSMQRNQGMIDRIQMVEGYNPLVLERAGVPVPDTKVAYDLYNVKYEIKVDLEKGSWAYSQRDSTLPRAWLVYDMKILDQGEVKKFMQKNNFDYRSSVILEEKIDVTLPGKTADTTGTSIVCNDYSTNKFSYHVKSKNNSILVFSEIYYPDWKVYVDGNKVKLLRANYSFRAIPLLAGEHTIEMKYESESYTTGKIISMITFVLSIVGFFFAQHFERVTKDTTKAVNATKADPEDTDSIS